MRIVTKDSRNLIHAFSSRNIYNRLYQYSPHGFGKLLAAALRGAVRDEPRGAQLRPVVARAGPAVGQVAVALAELAYVLFQLLPRRMRFNLQDGNYSKLLELERIVMSQIQPTIDLDFKIAASVIKICRRFTVDPSFANHHPSPIYHLVKPAVGQVKV